MVMFGGVPKKPAGMFGQAAAPAPAQNQYGGYTFTDPAFLNLVQESQQYAGQPYFDDWVKAAASGELAGSSAYEYGPYAEQKKAQADFKKMEEAAKVKTQGEYGDVKGQLQEMFAQKGLRRSGLAGEAQSRLAGSEETDIQRIRDDIAGQWQSYLQKMEGQRMEERQYRQQRRQQRRSNRYGVASQILGTAAGVGMRAFGI